MAVKIRMMRLGRRHRPFFRINVMDSRRPRDGRIIEKLGHYDPLEKDEAKQLVLNDERVKFWLGQGAVPSDTISDILKKRGIEDKHGDAKSKRRERARAIAKKAGKPFDKAERKAAEVAAAAAAGGEEKK